MKKKLYAIYSKSDKDSSVFSASSEHEVVDISFQVIFDSEDFDEFFDDNGQLNKNNADINLLFDVISDWRLFCIAEYDSENMKIYNIGNHDIDLKSLLNEVNKAVTV